MAVGSSVRRARASGAFPIDASGCFGDPGSVNLTARLSRSILLGMTVVVGVVDKSDVVIGSDGLLIGWGEPFRQQHLKSVRLNSTLCAAFSGDLYGRGIILSRMIRKPEWKEEGTICELWEDSGLAVQYGIEQAAKIAGAGVEEIFADSSLAEVQKNGVGVMLAGILGGRPYLWCCGQEKADKQLNVVHGDSGDISLGVRCPPDYEREYKLHLADGMADNAAGIVCAIRLIARIEPDKVNGNVCIRKFSSGFERDWRALA